MTIFKQIPSLPYRPLEQRANGMFDPVKEIFYPWKVTDGQLSGKKGIRYFLKDVNIKAYMVSDGVVRIAVCIAYIDGVESWVSGFSTQTENLTWADQLFWTDNLNVLLDSNTGVTKYTNCQMAWSLVYAEILSEEGELLIQEIDEKTGKKELHVYNMGDDRK